VSLALKRDVAQSGYKQTEIGLIPEGWEVRSLEKVCTMKSGMTITSDRINEFADYPCFGGNGLRGFTNSHTHEGNFALIGRQGALCGNIVKATGKFFASEHAIVVTPRRGVAINWLAIVLEKMNLNQYSESSAQPGLSVTKLQPLEIVFPIETKEQEAIAEALSDADGLIEALSELIAKKRQIKQGAMQDLLTGKKRLAGFEKPWKTQCLGDEAILKARIGWQGLTTKEYLDTGDYFLVTGTEFLNGFIDWNECFCVEEIRYSQDKNIQLKSNDLLVTKDGTIGKIAFVEEMPKPATLNSGVFVIRPKNKAFSPRFFYYLLRSEVFDKFLSQLSAGSTINHLYQKDFVTFKYELPSDEEEQIEIAKILTDMDTEISALETKLEKAKQIKQGMMQDLLSGKVRLI